MFSFFILSIFASLVCISVAIYVNDLKCGAKVFARKFIWKSIKRSIFLLTSTAGDIYSFAHAFIIQRYIFVNVYLLSTCLNQTYFNIRVFKLFIWNRKTKRNKKKNLLLSCKIIIIFVQIKNGIYRWVVINRINVSLTTEVSAITADHPSGKSFRNMKQFVWYQWIA